MAHEVAPGPSWWPLALLSGGLVLGVFCHPFLTLALALLLGALVVFGPKDARREGGMDAYGEGSLSAGVDEADQQVARSGAHTGLSEPGLSRPVPASPTLARGTAGLAGGQMLVERPQAASRVSDISPEHEDGVRAANPDHGGGIGTGGSQPDVSNQVTRHPGKGLGSAVSSDQEVLDQPKEVDASEAAGYSGPSQATVAELDAAAGRSGPWASSGTTSNANGQKLVSAANGQTSYSAADSRASGSAAIGKASDSAAFDQLSASASRDSAAASPAAGERRGPSVSLDHQPKRVEVAGAENGRAPESQLEAIEVLFLYGSQTGNAMEIAKSASAEAAARGIRSRALALSEKPLRALPGTPVAVFVVSSTGDGDPPENCERFFHAVKRRTHPSDLLQGLHYTVLALGDSNYTSFMYVPRVLRQRLQDLGATPFYEFGEADEVEGLEEVVDDWLFGLWVPLHDVVLLAANEAHLTTSTKALSPAGEAQLTSTTAPSPTPEPLASPLPISTAQGLPPPLLTSTAPVQPPSLASSGALALGSSASLDAVVPSLASVSGDMVMETGSARKLMRETGLTSETGSASTTGAGNVASPPTSWAEAPAKAAQEGTDGGRWMGDVGLVTGDGVIPSPAQATGSSRGVSPPAKAVWAHGGALNGDVPALTTPPYAPLQQSNGQASTAGVPKLSTAGLSNGSHQAQAASDGRGPAEGELVGVPALQQCRVRLIWHSELSSLAEASEALETADGTAEACEGARTLSASIPHTLPDTIPQSVPQSVLETIPQTANAGYHTGSGGQGTAPSVRAGDGAIGPTAGQEPGLLPSPELPFLAPVTDAQILTADWSDRTVIHLEVDLRGSGIEYRPGDSLAIHPSNDPDLVNGVLERLGVDGERVFSVASIDGPSDEGPRLLPHIHCPCCVRSALLRYCDLAAVPRKGLVRLLAEYCSEPEDRQLMLMLCSRSGRDEYRQRVLEARLNLLDLLQLVPSCRPPLDRLLDSLPPLVARFYSISCGPMHAPGRAQVAFSVVHIPLPAGRVFRGVTTTWLQRTLVLSPALPIRPASASLVHLPVAHKPGGPFCLPADLEGPLLLIGPGTGVAPFRGFLHERRRLIRAVDEGTKVGEAWLFFGCRRRDEDYLYGEELEDMASDGTLTKLVTAFSRETSSKVYVQHRLVEHGERLARLIGHPMAHVFVCGDGAQMVKDVHAALTTVLERHLGLTMNAVVGLLSQMVKDKRYVRDVWS